MMTEDPIATRFAAWAGALEFSDIPPEVVHQARRALLDTVGGSPAEYGIYKPHNTRAMK